MLRRVAAADLSRLPTLSAAAMHPAPPAPLHPQVSTAATTLGQQFQPHHTGQQQWMHGPHGALKAFGGHPMNMHPMYASPAWQSAAYTHPAASGPMDPHSSFSQPQYHQQNPFYQQNWQPPPPLLQASQWLATSSDAPAPDQDIAALRRQVQELQQQLNRPAGR